MKITFILCDTDLGGGNRTVLECANRLHKKEHEVTVVYPLVPLTIHHETGPKFVKGQFLGTLRRIKNGKKPKWFNLRTKLERVFTLSSGFGRFFQRRIPNSDVLVATAWETAYSLIGLNSKGVKAYFVQHYEIWDLWDDDGFWIEVEQHQNNGDRLCSGITEIVPENPSMRKFKELVDRTYGLPFKKITTSSWLKELIEKKAGEKVVGTVTIGNNFETFYREIHPDRRRDDRKKVLVSYRKKRWKGDGDGLRAVEIIKQKFPSVEILMYGPKKEADIPGWIKYYESPSDEQLRRLYCLSDIFIFPSWVEGWGSPPMEAMACGTACVTTNVGGVPEYTIPGETALVVPPRKPRLLAQAAISLLEDDSGRQQIAEAGHKYIQRFTWDQTVNGLEKILYTIAE